MTSLEKVSFWVLGAGLFLGFLCERFDLFMRPADPEDQFKAGALYEAASTPGHLKTAVEWYKKAADQGMWKPRRHPAGRTYPYPFTVSKGVAR
jgi:TPR repeat protein